MQNYYETVFILKPVLSEKEIADTVQFFKTLIQKEATILYEEKWGMKKLAYEIKKHRTGYYYYFEFKSDPTFIAKLATSYKQNEDIIRFMTICLDKHAIAYNSNRKNQLKSIKN